MKATAFLTATLAASGALANVVVDDTPVTANLTVSSGEELEIRGSGLAAATGVTVTFEGNNAVCFYTTATVAAKLVSPDLAVRSDAEAVGTFAGGAAFSGNLTLTAGKVCFTTKNVTSTGGLVVQGGHMTLANCTWTSSGNTSRTALSLASAAQVEDVCLELANGGVFMFSNEGGNGYCRIGKTAHESKLLVNGGQFKAGFDAFYLNPDNGVGTAIIEIRNGGVFATRRLGLESGSRNGSTRVVLGEGGTLLCNWGSWSGARLALGSGNLTYSVEGRATLDISNCPAEMKDANSATSGHNVRWSCTEDGLLTVKGRSDGTTRLALRNVDPGLRIGFAPYAGTVSLVNPPEAMELTLACATAESRVVSSNATCALSLNCLLCDGACVRSSPASLAEGFASVAVGNVSVDAPTASVYVSRNGMAAVPGTVSLDRGTLLLDTDPGEKLVRGEGTTVYVQDENPYVMTNATKWTKTTSDWLDPLGANRAWVPGALAAIDTLDINGNLDGVHVAHGLRVVKGGRHYWDGQAGRFEIGAGGLTFGVGGKMWGLASGSYLPRFVLTDNQLWTNEADETSYVQLGFSLRKPQYYKAYVTAGEGVTDWRLGGKLETWLYSPSNDLRNVTVTVGAPARLRLIGDLDARLNARMLVLDGADMSFGAATPSDTLDPPGDSVAAIDAFHLAPEVQLKDGGSLTVAKARTPFAVPTLAARGGGNRITGESVVVTQAVTSVSLPTAGDALAFESEVFGDAGRFDVAGAGRFTVPASLKADVVFRDGGTLELAGSGAFAGSASNAVNLIVSGDAGETVVIPDGALVDFGGTTITVTSGLLALMNAASVPSGVTVVTEGSGALLLVDPTGFDPSTQMGGTKNLVGSGGLIVTETARENETLTVGNGQVLQVFGSGLKASSKVIIEEGATLRFCQTATVYAPIVSTNGVTFEAVGGAVGRVAGQYKAECNAANDTWLDVVGDGSIDFGGGLDLAARARLRLNGGHMTVSSGELKTRSSLCMLAGDLTFTNSTLNVSISTTYGIAVLGMAEENQWGDVKMTFLAGSRWNQGNNHHVQVGRKEGVESRLVLDGGTWTCTTYDPFGVCVHGTGNGVFEFKSGTFESNRRIQSGGGNARFIWSGGTFMGRWNNYGYKYTYIFEGRFAECALAGDCTLDLHRFNQSVVSNFNNATGRMTVKPGARLTIKGDDTQAGYCSHVVLNGLQGDELTLRLVGSAKNGPVTVDLPDYGEAVRLGWTLGAEGTVNAIGTSPALVASYVVPEGFTFEQGAAYNDGWNTGFSSFTLNNLTFEQGAFYRFPITDSAVTPLAIAGKLTLPSAMTYFVNADVRPSQLENVTLIASEGGIEGDCTWTCGGGISRRGARVFVEDNALKFDYSPAGVLLIVR